jgi:hypothetical protein
MKTSSIMDDWEAGAELDAEIARRVFGEQIGQYGSGDDVHRFVTSYGVVRDLPPFSTDIGVAWKIVDELHARGFLIRVITYPKDTAPRPSDLETRVTCRVEQTVRGVHRRVAEADAANVPLAICQAALQVCQHR